MLRYCILSAALVVAAGPAYGAASVFTDLHGKSCKTIEADRHSGASTRRCTGVAGYSLLVHEASAQTSIDIVTPQGRVYPLEFWEVVTPGYSYVGRKAEWRVGIRDGKLAPSALLVRLNTINSDFEGPRVAAGSILTASRIARDGACVVYQGDAGTRSADQQARSAAAHPASKCLGIYTAAAR
ncbi:MAG: hypothetical protein V4723_12635 [Pseudomonadota bacterium]